MRPIIQNEKCDTFLPYEQLLDKQRSLLYMQATPFENYALTVRAIFFGDIDPR